MEGVIVPDFSSNAGKTGFIAQPPLLVNNFELSLDGGGGGGTVVEIQPGSGIAVDNTDPAYPIVSATGLGGSDVVTQLTNMNYVQVAGSSEGSPIVVFSPPDSNYWLFLAGVVIADASIPFDIETEISFGPVLEPSAFTGGSEAVYIDGPKIGGGSPSTDDLWLTMPNQTFNFAVTAAKPFCAWSGDNPTDGEIVLRTWWQRLPS